MFQKFATSFLNITDYFVYVKKNQSHGDIYKQRLLISISFILAILVNLMFIVRFAIEGMTKSKTLYILPLGALIFGACPWFLRKTGKRNLLSGLILSLGCAITTVRVISTGGISSPVTMWFAIIPLFAALLISGKASYIASMAILAILFIISHPQLFGITIHHFTMAPSLYVYIPGIALLIISSITYLYETERKKYEKIIRKSEQNLATSKKMASLGNLAAGIAHEINNPLAIIRGRAEMLKASVEQCENTDKMVNITDSIIETTTRITSIVQALRAYTRLDDQNSALEKIKMAPFLSAILENQKILAQESGVKLLNLNFKGELELSIHPQLIEQVIINLITNAIYAVKDLPEKWVEVGGHVDKELFIITVTDSGDGIPSDVLENIMDPFFTTKPVGVGTGLGLSFSLGIMEKHNGKLLYNKNSKNTQFILQLPLKQKSQKIY